VNWLVAGEILRWIFYDGFGHWMINKYNEPDTTPKYNRTEHPILIAEPFNFRDEDYRLLLTIVVADLKFPYVCLISSAVLALSAVGLKTGLVVEVDDAYASIVPVVQGKALKASGIQLAVKADGANLAEEAFKVISGCDKDQQTNLLTHILLCGCSATSRLQHNFLTSMKAISTSFSVIDISGRDPEMLVAQGCQILGSAANRRDYFQSREELMLLNSIPSEQDYYFGYSSSYSSTVTGENFGKDPL